MDELIPVTVLAKVGESQADFSSRLSALWTTMLREHEDEFEQVYAETAEFENIGGRLSRQYLMGEEVVGLVESKLKQAGLDYQPVDLDDRYSKYEAVPPEWMQIEH